MKEGIDYKGTFWTRLEKLMNVFGNNTSIKRVYVQKDGKINLTLLFKGDDELCEKLRIFLKAQMPTEENCTIFIKSDNEEYDYKVELIDIIVGK